MKTIKEFKDSQNKKYNNAKNKIVDLLEKVKIFFTNNVNWSLVKRITLSIISLLLVTATLWSASVFMTAWTNEADGRINVTISADGRKSIYTIRDVETVGDLFRLADIEVTEDDKVSYTLETVLRDGMEITIERAFPIAITAKDDVRVIQMIEGTVGDALTAADIDYDVHDELSHKTYEDTDIGMIINVVDVEVDYDTVYTTLDYEERVEYDPNMYEGNSVVVQEGSTGTKQITRRVVVKDGRIVSRKIVDQLVIEPAVDRIVRVGTRIRYQTNLQGEWRRWREPPTDDMIKEVMYVEVTAYTHTGDPTAMGTWPCLGTMAVNPVRIPYYSKIYVPGYGYGTALDTGGFRHDENGQKNLIDLFMDTEWECNRWGRKRNYRVYILEDWVYVPRHP
ncbi:MAG: G5 domain-containing protein [Clostridia bacterium]|nr:G5 domain-containing protein [Clostridia bacterium]